MAVWHIFTLAGQSSGDTNLVGESLTSVIETLRLVNESLGDEVSLLHLISIEIVSTAYI